MDDFKDSKTALVADVDCTAGGQSLCEKNGVKGYPTIKYGDPTDMQKYEGGRSYDDLKKFADENLGPTCGPDNLDLCNDEDKKLINKFMKMDIDELSEAIEEADTKIGNVQAKGEKAVKKLQDKMSALQKDIEKANKKKDEELAKEKKKLGYSMMKAVATAAKKKEEL